MKPLVVILAGGIGKTFSPLKINKTLLPIFGKPILQHVIEMVETADFHEALIVTNPENELWLSTYQPFNITLQTIVANPRGMGDTLLQARESIGSRPILIINAVDMVEPSFLKTLMKPIQNSYGFITGLKIKRNISAGYIKENNGKAIGIVEKPTPGNEPSDMVNLIFHYFSEPEDLFTIMNKIPTSDDQYEKALTELMAQRTIDIVPYNGSWSKLKYPHHVLDMMNLFLKMNKVNSVARSAIVSPHAVLDGFIIIDENARIDAGAIIKGPAYIGKNVKIGSHTLIRQSVIEEGSIIGFGSEVARSYIGPRSKLHHNFVGDSVFESDINPSWGTTFANWRIDGNNPRLLLPNCSIETDGKKLGSIIAKNVFFGVNCAVMPGVTIGAGAKIYPHKVIAVAVCENEVVK